jgi:hypothetical protein
MPRGKIGLARPDHKTIDVEIARLREVDVGALRARWHTLFGRRSPSHLPRHLLFRILAYRPQADLLGDLDSESLRLLDRSESPEKAGQRAVARRPVDVRPGTVPGPPSTGRSRPTIGTSAARSRASRSEPTTGRPAENTDWVAAPRLSTDCSTSGTLGARAVRRRPPGLRASAPSTGCSANTSPPTIARNASPAAPGRITRNSLTWSATCRRRPAAP